MRKAPDCKCKRNEGVVVIYENGETRCNNCVVASHKTAAGNLSNEAPGYNAKEDIEDWCDDIIVEAGRLLDECELSPVNADSLNEIIDTASKIKKAL